MKFNNNNNNNNKLLKMCRLISPNKRKQLKKK